MRALQAVCGTPWCITTEALQTILEIAARENLDVAAVEAQLGRKLDNSHQVTTRDGVATIPVEGPIFRRADFFTEVSGATSIETLAQDLRVALDDPTIRAIVLAVDSPGGAVNGVGEFAAMVYAARGQKPLTAYVSHQGASAAYWIAAACDEIVVAPTAMVGSIGVVAAVPDPTKQKARDIELVSSQSPRKRPDVTTEKGRAQLQATVDDIADQFIAAVATYRGVSPETVMADFGQGDVFVGQKAVDAGLANRVGTYEGTLAALQASAQGSVWPRVRTGVKGAAAHARAAVARTGEVVAAGGKTGMNWKFWEKTTPVERAELRASGVEVPDENTFSEVDARVEARLAEERAKDRAALRAERSKRLETEATYRADELVRAGKLTPPEREQFIAFRVAAAMDDMEATAPRPDGTSRVDAFDAIYAARPAHGLFKEYVDPGTGKTVKAHVLENPTGAGDPRDISTPEGAAAAATAWATRQGNGNGNGAH
jgi:signal peptide peptidase SppA